MKRDRLLYAVLAAAAIHALVLFSVRFPADHDGRTGGPLVVVPRPIEIERPATERRLARPGMTAEDEGTRASASTRPAERPERPERPEAPIPVIRESPTAAEETTIPPTGLTNLRAATLPLVTTPEGDVGRRRLERTPEQIATARAESLLAARLEGIAVVQVRDVGAVGLAGGGITIAAPWQGFLPADRNDETWREERCSGGDDGESDKAGEGEARRAQCS